MAYAAKRQFQELLEPWTLFIRQRVGAVPIAPLPIMLSSNSPEKGGHSKKVKLSHQPPRQLLLKAFQFQMAHHPVSAHNTLEFQSSPSWT